MMLVRLPQRKRGAGRILRDGHAAGIEDIKGRGQNLAPKLLGAGGSGVGAFDGDIQIPVRRDAPGELVGTKLAASRDVASFELKNRVDLVRADGKALNGPAKDFGVEVDGSVLVGGGEFNSAKFTGSVFFDVWH
jgi:hypothetical protein